MCGARTRESRSERSLGRGGREHVERAAPARLAPGLAVAAAPDVLAPRLRDAERGRAEEVLERRAGASDVAPVLAQLVRAAAKDGQQARPDGEAVELAEEDGVHEVAPIGLARAVAVRVLDRGLGRVVQRLCEIETYKAMSMLGLARVRALSPRLGEIDSALLQLVDAMSGGASASEGTLKELLALSSEMENLNAKASYRFAATRAYEAIVHQRIQVLREERFNGRQTFSEFMMRRFDPAMRTVRATEQRMRDMSERALRAGDLLRTSVDVERQAQNQSLLESMNRRADLQLRLQKTVEGRSVVAISYYAVNLVVYALGPVTEPYGFSSVLLFGLATPMTVLAVWWLVRRVRQSVE